ncbi:hypothetical protein [Telluria beijingensis]|uniref:hypothetical protein n=1 Tax=Telluria beijingensis TaxID=3068633 RepID=UPI002795FE4D|nr:hypothetical protein [Massilia sp. REN29]
MRRYANRNGDSGVVAYELGKHSITVRFKGGDRYLYTEDSTGADHIARMHALATEGRGLSTYISQHVCERYARKLD